MKLRRFSSLILVSMFAGGCGDSTGGGGRDGGGADMSVGGGGVLGGGSCAAPTGAGVTHSGFVMANETWTAAASPHLIPSTLYIRGATVTIEPCAVVRLAPGVGIEIGDSTGAPSAIVAHGTVTTDASGNIVDLRPIVFAPSVDQQRWGSLSVAVTGSLDFEIVGLTGGGAQSAAQNDGGTIVAYGTNMGVAVPMLRMRGVLVDSSGAYGVNLQRQAAFTADSEGLVIQGAGAEPPSGSVPNNFPVYIEPPAVQTLPTGTYTGNASDEILVYSNNAVIADESFHARGVPYRVRGVLYFRTIDHATVNTFTIDPGVTVKFDSSGLLSALRLGDGAGGTVANQRYTRFIAQGSAAEPITLTSWSSTPASGDWTGIQFDGAPTLGNAMSYVTVAYAGGVSSTSGYGCGPGNNDAAILITNWRPDDAFIQNCTIAHSKGSGIVSGWVSDLSGPDLKTGNTFTDIATGCDVSRWANATGTACPGTPPICF